MKKDASNRIKIIKIKLGELHYPEFPLIVSRILNIGNGWFWQQAVDKCIWNWS